MASRMASATSVMIRPSGFRDLAFHDVRRGPVLEHAYVDRPVGARLLEGLAVDLGAPRDSVGVDGLGEPEHQPVAGVGVAAEHARVHDLADGVRAVAVHLPVGPGAVKERQVDEGDEYDEQQDPVRAPAHGPSIPGRRARDEFGRLCRSSLAD